MLTELSNAPRVVGAKQVRRALEAGLGLRVFLADDTDPRVSQPVADICEEKAIAVERGFTMEELGRACGISVGAAVAAMVTEE